MKTILLVFSFLIIVDCFSQTTINDFKNLITENDLGFKTYLDVRKEISLIPCESYTSTINPSLTSITYCINDKENITYSFYNENLISINKEKKITSKAEVENIFKNVTTETKLKLGIEPELMNYKIKGKVSYYLTPTGEPDLYKIPLFDKDFSSQLSESFGGKMLTNAAGFNTLRIKILFGINVKFSEDELFFFESVQLRDYLNDSSAGRNK